MQPLSTVLEKRIVQFGFAWTVGAGRRGSHVHTGGGELVHLHRATRHTSKARRRSAAGTVRRPPRGVPKADFARLDYMSLVPEPVASAEW